MRWKRGADLTVLTVTNDAWIDCRFSGGDSVWSPAMCGENADLVVASDVWRECRFRVGMGGGT